MNKHVSKIKNEILKGQEKIIEIGRKKNFRMIQECKENEKDKIAELVNHYVEIHNLQRGLCKAIEKIEEQIIQEEIKEKNNGEIPF